MATKTGRTTNFFFSPPLLLLFMDPVPVSCVADPIPDPGSGAFLTPESGIRDGYTVIRIRGGDE